jgi:hypothetical protein
MLEKENTAISPDASSTGAPGTVEDTKVAVATGVDTGEQLRTRFGEAVLR